MRKNIKIFISMMLVISLVLGSVSPVLAYAEDFMDFKLDINMSSEKESQIDIKENPMTVENDIALESNSYNLARLENKPDNSNKDSENTINKNKATNNKEKREYKTQRFIIKYKNEQTAKGLESKLKASASINKLKKSKNKKFDYIVTDEKIKPEEMQSRLKAKGLDKNIEYIQPDYKMIISSTDPYYDKQWGIYNSEGELEDLPEDEALRQFVLDDMESMGLPTTRIDGGVASAWQYSEGKGAVVAVIDTGIDITHEDLKDNVWVNTNEIPDNGIDDDQNGYVDDINGWNFYDDISAVHSEELAYDEGHGTHIAGIIAAIKDNGIGTVGVAPKAKIMPLKVFQSGTAYTSDIIEAIEYAKNNGADIVNCSFGSTMDNPALKSAIEESGLIFVCAAGNSNKDLELEPVYPAAFDSSNIISVASINKLGVLSGFSNYGKISVDTTAPGEDIISTIPGNSYGSISGTSMAAAFVSGEAALLLDSLGNISSSDIKQKILDSADKLSSLTDQVKDESKINCENGVKDVISSDVIEISAVSQAFYRSNDSEEYNLFASDSWASKSNMPTARYNFGAVEIGTKIYTVGGKNESGYLNTLEEFDPQTNIWASKTGMASIREGAAVATAYGKLYAIGGYNGSYLNAVEEYDPVADTWVTKTSMPTARTDAGVAVINGKIYVVGGYNGSYLNMVQVYDPMQDSWETKASMPTARSELSVSEADGKLYAIGGYAGSYLNTVQEYDPTANIWTTKNSMPTSRAELSTSVANNKIFAIGGYDGSSYLETVEEYNPALNIWIRKTPMTEAVKGHGAAVLNSKIYIIGGYNGNYLNKVEEYTPSTDVWVEKASMLSPRGFFGTAAVDGKIYTAGGTRVGNSASQYEALNEFEVYDTKTDTWASKINMPSASFGPASVAVDGKIYVLGGFDWENGLFKENVEVYDPVTNNWIRKTDMSRSRYAPGATVLDGKIYVSGGYITDTAEVYNPSNNTWTPIASMPTRRYGLSLSAVNGKIYAIGGYNGSLLNIVEEYNPATNTWTTKTSMPTARNYHSAVVINEKIYVIGGQGGGYLNTVEVYDPKTDKWTTAPGMAYGRMRLGVQANDGRIYAIGGYDSKYLDVVEEYTAEYDQYTIEKHFGKEGANPATGNYSKTYTDMDIEVPGFNINLSRTYNSLDGTEGTLGRGWTFGFEASLKDDTSDSSIKVAKLPDGSTQTFEIKSDGSYTARDSRSQLVKNPDSTHTLVTKDQYQYKFNTNGYLTLMEDRYGNTVTITVDSSGKVTRITDITGRYFDIDYAGGSQIRYIRLKKPDSTVLKTVEYRYNGYKLLIAVVYPLGNITNYSYDSNKYLREIKDNDLNSLEVIAYYHGDSENNHKIKTETDSYGNTYTYTYDNANKETVITDKNGRQTLKHYDSSMYISSSVDAEGGERIVEYYIDSTGVNKYGEQKSVTDRNGNKTSYERDSRGNITKKIYADGSYEEFTYDEKNNTISEKDQMGRYTFYIYDYMTYLTRKAMPINGTDLYYSGCDESKFQITDYEYYTPQESISLGYLAKGLLKNEINPYGTVHYEYYADGEIKTITDEENKTTTYRYNDWGLMDRETSHGGVVVDYLYDANDNLEKKVSYDKNSNQEVLRITYDHRGRKTKKISPKLYNSSLDNISTHTYTGDHGYRYEYYSNKGGKLWKETDPENNTTEYTYDDYGNIKTKIMPNGGVYVYEYDNINRLKRVLFKESKTDTVEVLLETYDYYIDNGDTLGDGTILRNTRNVYTKYINDTESIVTTYIYDFDERLIEKQYPDGEKEITKYYSDGEVKSSTDRRGATTYYKYNVYSIAGNESYDEKWIPIDKDTGGNILYGYEATVYDKKDRVESEKWSKEKVSLYEIPSTFITKNYDYYNNNKVKYITYSDGRKIEYYYDNDNNLEREIVHVDSTGRNIVEYQNNHLGKPELKKAHIKGGDIYGNSFNNTTDITIDTSYTYDKNGNLDTITTPKVTTTYQYDNLDRQIGMSQPAVDEQGNATVIDTSTSYDWEGKTLTSTDSRGNTTIYDYNKRGFLQRVTKNVTVEGGSAIDIITAYEYDRVGRKIIGVSPENYIDDPNKTLSDMNRTEYVYYSTGNLKLKKDIYYDDRESSWVTLARAYKYDEDGNVIKKIEPLGYDESKPTVEEAIESSYGMEYTYTLLGKVKTVLDPASKDNGLSYSLKYEYDGTGRKTHEIQSRGFSSDTYYSATVYEYYDDGSIKSIKVNQDINDVNSAERLIQENTYDYLGNLLTQTDGNSNTVTYEYNAFGKVRKAVYPGDATIAGYTVEYQYDEVGNLKSQKDSLETKDIYIYDKQSRVLSHTQQKTDGTEGITVSTKYDKNGNVRFHTDGEGVTIESTYDELNRLRTKTITNGDTSTTKTTEYRYDKNGNLTKEIDWRLNAYTNIYDSINRLIERKDPNNKMIQKLHYDKNSRQDESYDALNHKIAFEYDKNDRLIKTTDAENHWTSQSYDNAGNIRTKNDGKNNITTYFYDEFNNLVRIENPKSEISSYTYDLAGNMLTQTDGSDNTITMEYNARNLPVKRIDHGGRWDDSGIFKYDPAKTEEYTYYADGNIKIKVDRNGKSTVYSYDSHKRLSSQVVDGVEEISYTYDDNGNTETIKDNTEGTTHTTTMTYDDENRLLTKTETGIGTIGYQYDIIAGLPSGHTAQIMTDAKGNTVKRVFDKTGRLYQVISDGKTTVYTYYDNGSKESITYPNSTKEYYTYYNNNLLKTLENKRSDESVIEDYSYTYDGANNKTTKTDEKGTTTYGYDSLNRLETVSEPSGKTTTYTYDRAGNRETETESYLGNTTVTTYRYNEQNRLESEVKNEGSVKETTKYEYDNNGNLLSKRVETEKDSNPTDSKEMDVYVVGVQVEGEKKTVESLFAIYRYDVYNRLIEANTGKNDITYRYNGNGQRIEKKVDDLATKYLYEYDKVVLELDDIGNEKAKNIYGLELVSRKVDGETLYYHYNGHGDVTALIDDMGVIRASYYYDAFGNIIEESGDINNPIRYSGYQYDEDTDMYYLNARYYDSKIARFITEDTYRGSINDPLSLNLYAYCVNNPIKYWDPSGHWGGAAGEYDDSKLSIKDQRKIKRLTDAWFSAGSKKEQDRINAEANKIRENAQLKKKKKKKADKFAKAANKVIEEDQFITAEKWIELSKTFNRRSGGRFERKDTQNVDGIINQIHDEAEYMSDYKLGSNERIEEAQIARAAGVYIYGEETDEVEDIRYKYIQIIEQKLRENGEYMYKDIEEVPDDFEEVIKKFIEPNVKVYGITLDTGAGYKWGGSIGIAYDKYGNIEVVATPSNGGGLAVQGTVQFFYSESYDAKYVYDYEGGSVNVVDMDVAYIIAVGKSYGKSYPDPNGNQTTWETTRIGSGYGFNLGSSGGYGQPLFETTKEKIKESLQESMDKRIERLKEIR